MLITFAFRSDTVANFTALNRVYDMGEPLYETDTKRLRIADGVTPYNDLPVQSVDIATLTALSNVAVSAATDAETARDEAVAAAGGATAATLTSPGVVRLATTTEAITGTDDTIAVTPAGLEAAIAGFTGAPAAANTTTAGIVELATNTEAAAGTDTVRAVTPAGVAAAVAALGVATPDATTTVKGKAELATNAETITGTDTVRTVTPAGLAAAIAALPVASTTVKGPVTLATSAEATTATDAVKALTPATGKAQIDAFPTSWTNIGSKPAVIAAGATADAAQTALGGSTVGKGVFGAASALDAQTALGGSTVGRGVFTAVDALAGRTALAAAADSAVMKLTGDQTIAGLKTFSTGIDVPDETLASQAIIDFAGAVDDANQTAQVVHGVVYDEGDPLPTLPTTGLWMAVKRSAAITLPTYTDLATTPGSSADGTSWTITLSRAIAAGAYAIAFVDLATTGTSPFLPTTLTGGGMTWTIPNDPAANPMSGLTADNKQGMAMFVGVGTGSGTSLTLSAGGTMQGAAWRVVEVANAAGPPVQYAKSASTVSATPSAALPGVDPTNSELGFLGQNTSTDCTIGSGFTEIGTLNIAPGAPPAVSAKAEYRDAAVGTVGFSGATAASKRVFAVEIPAA